MSTKKDHLIGQIEELVESGSRLRAQLQDYERAMVRISRRLEKGEPALTAARGTGIATQRRQLTEAIQEFEADRHHLRLALFAQGKEEGASMSEIGRVLGISRQLASRLGREAAVSD